MVATLGLPIHSDAHADHSRPSRRLGLSVCFYGCLVCPRPLHMTTRGKMNVVTRPKVLHKSVSEGKVGGSIAQI